MRERILGINGLGRIGKLTVWNQVSRGHFDRLVVNVGREVGTGLEAVCHTIENDSTYGPMHRFLHGVDAEPSVGIADREHGLLEVDGTPVQILRDARNPKDIGWHRHGVRVVVDTTGAFNDPHADVEAGSLYGHLAAGAELVVNSAPFKSADSSLAPPEDTATLIYGINHEAYDPAHQRVVAAASCTTTALAHMVKPVIDSLHHSSIMTASMHTVHAVTNSQSVLDTVPRSGKEDLRKSRSILNNIILTSTGAARALERVIPEIRGIGFMADSVRIPSPTESLIILNVTFQTVIGSDERASVNRDSLNDIYREAATGPARGLLVYSEAQNVSADVKGLPAAVVIEAKETHTRTGFVNVDLTKVPDLDEEVRARLQDQEVRLPVTHAKLFGWYDNEYGSYTCMLGELTRHLARRLG